MIQCFIQPSKSCTFSSGPLSIYPTPCKHCHRSCCALPHRYCQPSQLVTRRDRAVASWCIQAITWLTYRLPACIFLLISPPPCTDCHCCHYCPAHCHYSLAFCHRVLRCHQRTRRGTPPTKLPPQAHTCVQRSNWRFPTCHLPLTSPLSSHPSSAALSSVSVACRLCLSLYHIICLLYTSPSPRD